MQTVVLLLCAVLCSCCSALAQTRPDRVVLVTADGLRWQDLFTGIDPALMDQKTAGMASAAQLQKQLWAETPEKRRELLMPFFWGSLAPRGVVFGNKTKGSVVRVSNSFRVSYPGYSEIVTGRAQDSVVRGNDKIQNPSQTVFEFLRAHYKLTSKDVAMFASWDVFPFIGESKPGSIFVNAGYMKADDSPRMKELSEWQFRMRTPWDSVRHDFITLHMALDYMRRNNPRITYIALGETDDWAHGRRYDRTLTAIQDFDTSLREIWEFLESSPEYRGRTLLVITTDHGRGSTLEDWHGHGSKVEGADHIWLALTGPGVSAVGEVTGGEPVMQRDVAPTMLQLIGLDYTEYKGVEGKPIVLPTRRPR